MKVCLREISEGSAVMYRRPLQVCEQTNALDSMVGTGRIPAGGDIVRPKQTFELYMESETYKIKPHDDRQVWYILAITPQHNSRKIKFFSTRKYLRSAARLAKQPYPDRDMMTARMYRILADRLMLP